MKITQDTPTFAQHHLSHSLGLQPVYMKKNPVKALDNDFSTVNKVLSTLLGNHTKTQHSSKLVIKQS
jgi:hypothetical protein